MKLDKLLQDVAHLGFVEAHDPPGLIARPDGFRAKTKRAWADALRERKPGNRRPMAAIALAESESRRIGELEARLNAAYAAGRRRAMEPAPERVSPIAGPSREKSPVHRRFHSRDIRWGLTQAELDAIPCAS